MSGSSYDQQLSHMRPKSSAAPEAYIPPPPTYETPTEYLTPITSRASSRASSYPEVYHVQDSIAPEVYIPPPPAHDGGTDKEAQLQFAARYSSTLCGLRRRRFWVLVIVIIAAVFGGIGGGVASKRMRDLAAGSSDLGASQSGESSTPTSLNDSGVITLDGSDVMTGDSSSTANAAEPAKGSNFAAVNWNSTFMIFYQDNSQNIRMVESNFTLEPGNLLNYTWSRASTSLFSARKGSSIAAIGWLGRDRTRQIRVYVSNDDNAIMEWGWGVKNGWIVRPLTDAAVTGFGKSQITVVRTNKSIRVFYQDASNRLAGQVYRADHGWVAAGNFTSTSYTDWPLVNTLGSGLSAVEYPLKGPRGIRLYYQDTEGELNWWQGSSVDSPSESWAVGTQLETIPDQAPLSAVVVPTLEDRQLQLFYVQGKNLVAELWNSSSGATSPGVKETSGQYLGPNGLDASGPGVAAVTWDEMVLVIIGEDTWFHMWQYTPASGTWSNPSIPVSYFVGE